MKDTGKTPAAPKSPNVKENGEENEKRGCMAEWPTFLGTFLAKEVRTHFSKNGSSAQFEHVPILFPLHAITISTTFWQNLMIREKDKMGSLGLMGSPFDIWFFPIGPKV